MSVVKNNKKNRYRTQALDIGPKATGRRLSSNTAILALTLSEG